MISMIALIVKPIINDFNIKVNTFLALNDVAFDANNMLLRQYCFYGSHLCTLLNREIEDLYIDQKV